MVRSIFFPFEVNEEGRVIPPHTKIIFNLTFMKKPETQARQCKETLKKMQLDVGNEPYLSQQ